MAATNERSAATPNQQQPLHPVITGTLSPPEISARMERNELERSLLSAPPHSCPHSQPQTLQIPTTPTAAASMSMPPIYYTAATSAVIPTAVPIEVANCNDEINDDDVAFVAVATAIPADAVCNGFLPPITTTCTTTNPIAPAPSTRAFLNRNCEHANVVPMHDDDAFVSLIRSHAKADYGKNDPTLDDILVVPELGFTPTSTNLNSLATQPARTNLRAANVMGTISSEEEIADVARAQRHVRHAVQGQSELAIHLANVKAVAARDQPDEGLAVDEKIHHAHCDIEAKREVVLKKEQENEEDVSPYADSNRSGKRGYEVRPYDVSDYDAKGHEYEVTEYKSVYD